MNNDDIFSILEDVIDNRFKINLDSNNFLVIEENAPDFKTSKVSGRTVKIKRRGKVFAFSLDKKIKGLNVFPFFNNSIEGINKKNEAIVFCQDDNDMIYALIVELKSQKEGDAKKQILSGKNFVKFLVDTINLNYNKRFKVNIRGILFSTRKESARVNPTYKKGNLVFQKLWDIEFTRQDCNKEYYISEFLA